MKITVARFALLIAFISLPCGTLPAQVQTGTPPFSKIGGGPADEVDLANLNVHLDVPIVNKAGRGISFTYTLGYDNSTWTPVGSSGSQTWVPAENWGWSVESAAATGEITYQQTMQQVQCYPSGNWGYLTTEENFSYIDPFGTQHPIPGAEGGSYCGIGEGFKPGTAIDGSGYTLTLGGSYGLELYDRSGRLVNGPWNSQSGAAGFEDSNGNEITVSSSEVFTDTLGTTALTVSGTAPNDTIFQYTAPNGSPEYKMVYSSYTVQTNFGCSGVSEFPATQEYLVSEIDLPDGTKYLFNYETTYGDAHTPHYVTGRLSSVTLPTGGSISYTYGTGGVNGIECADGSASTLTRTVSPGGTWSYSRTINAGSASTTTAIDPQTNQTVLNFIGIYPTEEQDYQGSSTLLKTTITCYNGSTPSGSPATCNSDSINLPIAQQTIYNEWPTGPESETNTMYNSFGLATEEDDYDYGNGSPGSLLRKTITAYASLGNNIVNRPTSVTVCSAGGTASACNGSGTVVAQTTYQYDQGTPASSGISTQHATVSGSRGNPTTISYLVSGSTSLTRTFTYFDTGNVDVAKDVNLAQASFTYGACYGAFPTSVSEPMGFSASAQWNCTGGVQTSATDENGNTASTAYTTDEYFWRPNSITDQENYTTNITYTGETSVESTLNFGTSSTSDVLTTLDSLGRPEITQVREAHNSSTLDSVQAIYDSVGRTYQTTLPYAAGGGATCSQNCYYTTTSYDALGRPLAVTDAGGGTVTYGYTANDVVETLGPAPSGENTKRKQLQFDALGRLTSVCEITSGTGSGPCPQTNAQTGYYTQYTYDALGDLTGVSQDSGAQTRSYVYDGLGRMTSETNPETGTTSYTFDTDATCGTYDGDLAKKVDAAGNVTCYAYDQLHHLTSATVKSGPYASVTPIKNFVYGPTSGSVTVDGTAMANAKTRLAEAYTCASPCSTKITDEGFSYTARGEIAIVYESTPHSGGWYSSGATYWANGALETLNDSAGYSLSFGVDGEGRPYSSTDGSGGHPLASTLYNSASLPTQLSFGYTGDSDYYAYDRNTNRMTQYKFTVNGQSLTGNLSWNANGTLGSLLITDPFNSSDTQSCTYTHDDLSRIASTNCGGAASQTFSYDGFGNIEKSGSPYSFQADYSSTTNQMTSIGGQTPTYDTNGNVTNDFLNQYTWDANGRPITVANSSSSVAVTYDALGRMVEQNRSGAYTEILYAPTGFELSLMNGQPYVKEFAPMPGGGSSVWTPSLFYYRHADWLGSSRFASTKSRTMYYDGAYAPFGENYAESGTTDRNFTGMDQDTTSTVYDFPAREYGIQGRWPSPDPAGLAAVNPADPQSWNRYAYVRNSPLMLTDPSGMDDCPPDVLCVTTSSDGSPLSPPTVLTPTCNPFYIGGCGIVSSGPPPGFILDGLGDGCYNSVDGAGVWCPDPPTAPILTLPPLPVQCPTTGATTPCPAPPPYVPGGGGGGGGPQPQQTTKPQQPQQQPQQPKKQPFYCGTGNSWSHPFTAPTGRQWGQWSVADLGIAFVIDKYTKGYDPVSRTFTASGLLEAWGWASCD
jgi:RHS repeat-associated protein